MISNAEVAQLVEQWTENPCVASSSLALGTIFSSSTAQDASRATRIDDRSIIDQSVHDETPLVLRHLIPCRTGSGHGAPEAPLVKLDPSQSQSTDRLCLR